MLVLEQRLDLIPVFEGKLDDLGPLASLIFIQVELEHEVHEECSAAFDVHLTALH
ncbi:hypothetical protein D3C78_1819800 [compost metagenome]